MAMRKIKKNDVVVVLVGNDRGKRGRVLRVVKKQRVIVEGVNLVKKHVKSNPQSGEQGGVINREATMPISNVALALSVKGSKKSSKVGFKFLEDGRKVRYFKSDNELVDV
jgi:large subunit ribosomal protein L24